MKFSNYVKYGLVALSLLAGTAIGVKYAWDLGHKQGATDTANEIFRYCHDHGGILTNHLTGEKIGCLAVVLGPQT